MSFLGSGSRHLPLLSFQEIPKLERLKIKLASGISVPEYRKVPENVTEKELFSTFS